MPDGSYRSSVAAMVYVSSEDEIIPALRKPFVRAVTLLRPDEAATYKEMQAQIPMVCDPEVAKAQAFEYQPKLNQNNTPEDYVARAGMLKIPLTLEMAKFMYNDLQDMIDMYVRIYAAYTGAHADGRGDVNIVPKGGYGRTPFLHSDFPALTVHIAVMFSALEYLNRAPSNEEWQIIANSDFETDPPLYVPPKDIARTSIGNAVFMKGGVELDDIARTKDVVFLHRSALDIADTGQISFNIF